MSRPDPQSYLGGHDAGPALGLAPFGRTRFVVWEEKTGRRAPSPVNWRMEKGMAVEPLMRGWYAKEQGVQVEVPSFMRHKDEPIMGGHVDAYARLDDGRFRLVEFKTSMRREFWHEPPKDYVTQVEHYGEILRSHLQDKLHPVAHIVVDCGEEQPKVFEHELRPASLAYLLEAERDLWFNYIDKDVAPPPENIAECMARWPDSSQAVMEAPPALVLLLAQLDELKEQKEATSEQIKALELEVKRYMGDAGTLLYMGRTIATWHTDKKGRASVDIDALKEAGLYERYSKEGKPARRFLPKTITAFQREKAQAECADSLKETHAAQ